MHINIHKELFDLHNSTQHLTQDKDDIQELVLNELASIRDVKRRKNLSTFMQYFCHACAIYDALYSIHQIKHNSDKTTAILYLPFILLLAHWGFKDGKKAQEYKTEYQNQTQQYVKLKKLIETSKPDTLHNIAQTYRSEIPKEKENELTPESLQNTIHHILMKYER